MNISQAARQAGLTPKALRYYESIGLLVPVRGENGYRDYAAADVATLQFIQRARACGFAIEEVRELLSLYRNPSRRSHDAKALVAEKLAQVERQLQSLRVMRETLAELADSCPGDDSPNCRILDQLAGGK
ncbi:Cu(I)-responsive transcriptional regulator [Microbulbifer agarilyticus]|uniref:Cu(I)-responsive transcriptional regulator n=1 Tax=Microbulbifer agarilyticus TaxID=260552 RepID=UPI001C9651E2|nr:Cu(I)-responsive transcriptional regulator [Microbulbifer agarilyticus]MBY6189782.1 Cu(I)-responsive transcriptional regulator [Microbulbifer agarilyticus]